MENELAKQIYRIVEGIILPFGFQPHCVKEAIDYKPLPEDVIIATYPKCGTTWMQNILIGIFRQGVSLDPANFHDASPFIDASGLDGIKKMPRPGPLKTHLPFTHVPYSSEAKYVFITRNPFDTCVSMYHHTRRNTHKRSIDINFDNFFELFVKGEVEYGDYFDHLLSWYPHRNDSNVFFTTYENMKKDIRTVVCKLGLFLGEDYNKILSNDGVLTSVLRLSSFQYMQETLEPFFNRPKKQSNESVANNPKVAESRKGEESFTKAESSMKEKSCMEEEGSMKKGSCTKEQQHESVPKEKFMRKGIVGDWKNYFSPEQFDRLYERAKLKTAATNICNLWQDIFEKE